MATPNDERPVSMNSGVGRLKEDSRASMTELRQFLDEMKGKGPVEMLGTLAKSHLARAFVLACVGLSVFLVVGTVVPAAFSEGKVEGIACLNKACNKMVTLKGFRFCPHCGTRKGENYPPSVGGTAAAKAAAEKSGVETKTDQMARAAKAMKIDEVKKGSPKEIDNLLNIDLDK